MLRQHWIAWMVSALHERVNKPNLASMFKRLGPGGSSLKAEAKMYLEHLPHVL